MRVCSNCGSDPLSILAFGKLRFREEKEAGDAFDRVFCVFDKDSHTNYSEALKAIKTSVPRNTFVAINSVPCFEYWLLLHHTYTTRPYMPLHGNSICTQVITELRNYMADYAKGRRDVFTSLINQLEYAKNNARRALKETEITHTDNPMTHMHELVEYLQNIKSHHRELV